MGVNFVIARGTATYFNDEAESSKLKAKS